MLLQAQRTGETASTMIQQLLQCTWILCTPPSGMLHNINCTQEQLPAGPRDTIRNSAYRLCMKNMQLLATQHTCRHRQGQTHAPLTLQLLISVRSTRQGVLDCPVPAPGSNMLTHLQAQRTGQTAGTTFNTCLIALGYCAHACMRHAAHDGDDWARKQLWQGCVSALHAGRAM